MSGRTEHTASYWAGFGRKLLWLALSEDWNPSAVSPTEFMCGADSGYRVWRAEERHAWGGSPRPAHPVLDLPMQPNDANASTVREYLTKLLSEVWYHGEGFNGKRPFGNSGWHTDLYEVLVKAGLVCGAFDEWECLDDLDHDAADWLIMDAIRAMGGVQ